MANPRFDPKVEVLEESVGVDGSKVKRLRVAETFDVDVLHKKRNQNGCCVLDLVAAVGLTRVSHSWTIGAVDGPRLEPPTAEELQEILDQKKAELAKEAAWQESVREAAEGL